MILAAGLGTRLRPLTDHCPKPLLPVGKVPLIFYTLFLLRHYGIKEVVINLHHNGKMIQEKVGQGEKFGMKIIYSEEETLLGTGGGLKKMEWFFKSGPFLLINADILVNLNLHDLFSFHQEKGGMGTLVLRKDPDVKRYGVIERDMTGRVQRFLGKPKRFQQPLDLFMFTGIQILDPEIFRFFPEAVFHSITDTYLKLVVQGKKLFGYETTDYWLDLGTPARYERAQKDYRLGKLSFDFLPPG